MTNSINSGFGWTKKVLQIDLSSKTSSICELSEDECMKYLGGRGFGGLFLKDFAHFPYHHSEMPLSFFTGALTGSGITGTGLVNIMTRSPLTGTVFDENVGGELGFMIKRCGLDGIVIKGVSTTPVRLEVESESVEFVDASSLAGKTLSELKNILPADFSSAVCGASSGHNVLYSSISVDGEYFAHRGGLGLVMASKGLKALSVKGSKSIEVYDSDKLAKASEDIDRLMNASPFLRGKFGISSLGTSNLYDLISARHMMPSENFRKTHFEHSSEMNAYHFERKYGFKSYSCNDCFLKCRIKTSDGRHFTDYNAMSHLSALIGVANKELILTLYNMSTEYGFDAVSAAVCLALYMEIKGLEPSDVDFQKEFMDIALGGELSTGAVRLAEKYGADDMSMTVKGLELPAYDPRGAYGLALAYAVSTKGATETRAYPVTYEILRKPVAVDRFEMDGKARLVKLSEDVFAAADALGICAYTLFSASLEEYSNALNAFTGSKFTAFDLSEAGCRIDYNERMMNSVNGFGSEDDILPELFFREEGTSADDFIVPAIDRASFDSELQKYYKLRGLDKGGRPLETMAKKLGVL